VNKRSVLLTYLLLLHGHIYVELPCKTDGRGPTDQRLMWLHFSTRPRHLPIR